jgi:hypothetical protein
MLILTFIVTEDQRGQRTFFEAALAQARERAVSMCVISLRRLAMAEAEGLIAAVWYAAEEHRLPSPRLRVRQIGEALDLHVEFASEEDGALMRRVVPRLAVEPSSPRLALVSYHKLVQILSFARSSTKIDNL